MDYLKDFDKELKKVKEFKSNFSNDGIPFLNIVLLEKILEKLESIDKKLNKTTPTK